MDDPGERTPQRLTTDVSSIGIFDDSHGFSGPSPSGAGRRLRALRCRTYQPSGPGYVRTGNCLRGASQRGGSERGSPAAGSCRGPTTAMDSPPRGALSRAPNSESHTRPSSSTTIPVALLAVSAASCWKRTANANQTDAQLNEIRFLPTLKRRTRVTSRPAAHPRKPLRLSAHVRCWAPVGSCPMGRSERRPATDQEALMPNGVPVISLAPGSPSSQLHAVMTQDRIRRGDMKMDVGQQVRQEIGQRLHALGAAAALP